MKKVTQLFLIAGGLFLGGCDKYLDINNDPNSQKENNIPLAQVFTSVTLNVGFTGGSDVQRYTGLLMQQYSGQTTGGETQTQAFEKYLIQATDLNNLFSALYAGTLNDIELVIKEANRQGSPHYAGVAKLLKAYTYQMAVDIWGDQPYSDAQGMVNNLFPKYDDDAAIYAELIKLIDAGIADINQAASISSPGTNSTIYPGAFASKKQNWIKFANTLKLRLYIHLTKLDKADAVNKITALVNANPGFMEANADNFQHVFLAEARRQNPIHQFELNRTNYIFPNKFIVDMMNSKTDPRRASYFTTFPANSGNYKGAAAGDVASQLYSRIHTFLRGATTNIGPALANGSWNATGVNAISYNGAAPVRMLTFAEYNFIRAEAVLYGAPGDAQAFFTAGITASMKDAGVSDADIAIYLAANGTLTGSDEDKLKQIIDEKYVANYGVAVETWTDWRRTGYPAISIVGNAILNAIPRSLLYPQSEMDLNTNAPEQKGNMLERVFWDKQ
jgi:hypothetical protein